MAPVREQLEEIFHELNERVTAIAQERAEDGLRPIPKANVKILGQMSLLASVEVSAVLSLAQTGDMDALVTMEHVVLAELRKILTKNGLVYDDDSDLIWIPPGATFAELLDLEHVQVSLIDAESALVSKAVKAPQKNKQLMREAIASEKFPGLIDRILEHGGRLEDFA
jgi:hypothetical protein